MRRILITGGAGQIGSELQALDWPSDVRLDAPSRADLTLTHAGTVHSSFAQQSYVLVINTAAFTAVDKAEDEVAEAFAANALVPAILADACRTANIPLIQVSTDYVFNGSKSDWYAESDPTDPQGVYGASKRAGELAALVGNPRTLVLRTAWVFSPYRANFVKTMLRVGRETGLVRVVADQIGCPTSAADIARAIRHIALRYLEGADGPCGIYHFVNKGEASWHDFAREIFLQAESMGGPGVEVEAISTADYPTRARRPANSRLSTLGLVRDFGIAPRPWQEALSETLTTLSDRNEI